MDQREQIIKDMLASGLTFDGIVHDLTRARDAYKNSLVALEKQYSTLNTYEEFSQLKASISLFDKLIGHYRSEE